MVTCQDPCGVYTGAAARLKDHHCQPMNANHDAPDVASVTQWTLTGLPDWITNFPQRLHCSSFVVLVSSTVFAISLPWYHSCSLRSSATSAASDDSPRQADLPYPMSAWTWDAQEAAAAWMVVPKGDAGLGLQVRLHLHSVIILLALVSVRAVGE